VLGGRCRAPVCSDDPREVPDALGAVGCDRLPELCAECDDQVHAARRHVGRAQAPEGRDRVRGRHARPQVEFEEVVGMGALGEDAELGEG
jgi:hypothetical protein